MSGQKQQAIHEIPLEVWLEVANHGLSLSDLHNFQYAAKPDSRNATALMAGSFEGHAAISQTAGGTSIIRAARPSLDSKRLETETYPPVRHLAAISTVPRFTDTSTFVGTGMIANPELTRALRSVCIRGQTETLAVECPTVRDRELLSLPPLPRGLFSFGTGSTVFLERNDSGEYEHFLVGIPNPDPPLKSHSIFIGSLEGYENDPRDLTHAAYVADLATNAIYSQAERVTGNDCTIVNPTRFAGEWTEERCWEYFVARIDDNIQNWIESGPAEHRGSLLDTDPAYRRGFVESLVHPLSTEDFQWTTGKQELDKGRAMVERARSTAAVPLE